MIPTAAALRTSTLPTQGSPFALPDVCTWRDRNSTLGVNVDMRAETAFRSLHPTNNSIAANLAVLAVPTAAVTPVQAGRSGYGAAKQAAPPRGVPR